MGARHPDAFPLDRATLEIARLIVLSDVPLDDMLKSEAQTLILKCVARRHLQRRAQLDVKKLQANDIE